MTTELENEKRIIDWLGVIAMTAIIGFVLVAIQAPAKPTTVDVSALVALIGVAGSSVTAMGVRRTRVAREAEQTAYPPPYTGG